MIKNCGGIKKETLVHPKRMKRQQSINGPLGLSPRFNINVAQKARGEKNA